MDLDTKHQKTQFIRISIQSYISKAIGSTIINYTFPRLGKMMKVVIKEDKNASSQQSKLDTGWDWREPSKKILADGQ